MKITNLTPVFPNVVFVHIIYNQFSVIIQDFIFFANSENMVAFKPRDMSGSKSDAIAIKCRWLTESRLCVFWLFENKRTG